MSTLPAALGQRLSKFQEQFKKVLGPKRQGYGELGVNEPLVGSDGDHGLAPSSDYARQHGVAPPGSGFSSGPQRGYTGGNIMGSAADVPSQSDELRQLAALSREAAEILWEMAAMNDAGDAAQEMVEKSTTLQAQLRGMIGDYRDTDEEALAGALEVYDQLSNTLSEYSGKKPAQAPGAQSALPQSYPAQQQNPFDRQAGAGLGSAPGSSQAAPGHKPQTEEAPLISFD